jgi:hypothetical protein
VRARIVAGAALVAFATEPRAAAEPANEGPIPVDFQADEVRFEASKQALDVSGHVRVDVPPFTLTSDRVLLRRSRLGVDVEGKGELAFCPCLGTPLAVRFDGATVAPPHDVIVNKPTLVLFGLPVLWAPAFWLRSPARFGVLAPEVAYRGADGVFLGEGIHVPWRDGDGTRGLDLRGGAYLQGGAAVQASLTTSESTTRVRWDDLRNDQGLAIDARGATGIASPRRDEHSVAWDVDVVRGARGVASTTDLDAAARAFDRATAEAAWRASGWTFASGMRAVTLRGGDATDLGAVGPIVTARRSGALGGVGAYDATIESGAVVEAARRTTSFARGEGGALAAARLGPVGASLALRGVGTLADDGVEHDAGGAASARARIGLPLARGFESEDANDPWIHRTEPRLEAAALATHTSAVLVAPMGRGAILPPGVGWVAAAGWSNAIARWGSRSASEVDLAGGLVGDSERALPSVRARVAVDAYWVALGGEAARVFSRDTVSDGDAYVARARIGAASSLHVAATATGRDGIDPILARTLVDAPLEPASGFLVAPGWTGGGRVVVPWTRSFTTRAGADADLSSQRLLSVAGAIELHDPCGCVVVRASGAHRLGRDGVDVWLTIDLPPP